MQRIRKRHLWSLLVGLIATLATRADGPWHVSTNGVDAGRDGLSWAQAWRTLSNAVARATTGTIYVSNGVYTLGEQIYFTKALTIEGVGAREDTVVNGNGVTRCFTVKNAAAVLRNLTITNGYITGNSGVGNGGGVRLLGGTLDNCRVVGNAAQQKGGGVYIGYAPDVGDGGVAVVTNCLVDHNTANIGGGISLSAAGATSHSLTLVDSEVAFNEAKGASAGGGGVYFQGGKLTIRRSHIVGNASLSSSGANPGGGVRVDTPLKWTLIEDSQIVGNVASNTSVAYGGGLYFKGNNHVIRNCLIARNKAYFANNGFYAWGGGIYFDALDATNRIESCTIAGNHAMSWWQDPKGPTPGGSAIYFNGNGQDVVTNCIVYGNTGFPDWFFGNSDRTNRIHYTCSPVPLGGVGNLVADPKYVNSAAGDFRLRSTSPCLNAGISLPWMASALDLDGNPRVDTLYRTPDMGCYERVWAGSMLFVR